VKNAFAPCRKLCKKVIHTKREVAHNKKPFIVAVARHNSPSKEHVETPRAAICFCFFSVALKERVLNSPVLPCPSSCHFFPPHCRICCSLYHSSWSFSTPLVNSHIEFTNKDHQGKEEAPRRSYKYTGSHQYTNHNTSLEGTITSHIKERVEPLSSKVMAFPPSSVS